MVYGLQMRYSHLRCLERTKGRLESERVVGVQPMPVVLPKSISSSVSSTKPSLVFLSREVEKGSIWSSNAVFAPSSPRKNERSARIGNSRRGATDASMCPNQSVCPSLIPIKPCIPFQRGCIGWNMVCKSPLLLRKNERSARIGKSRLVDATDA